MILPSKCQLSTMCLKRIQLLYTVWTCTQPNLNYPVGKPNQKFSKAEKFINIGVCKPVSNVEFSQIQKYKMCDLCDDI